MDLGASWEDLGRVLGGFWEGFGRVWRRFWEGLGVSWALLDASGVLLGVSWGHLLRKGVRGFEIVVQIHGFLQLLFFLRQLHAVCCRS